MSDHENTPSCSVVIPAYNEEGTIAATLNALLQSAHPDEFDVIVVCNGCVDNTVEVARMAAPNARIIDLKTASKTAALNAGIAAARHNSVVLLDADIKTTAEAVRVLVRFLAVQDADLAYGNAHFNTERCSGPVRAFYGAWQQNSYFDRRKVGGFFALSLRGLNRLGTFPETTNDDEYVRRKLIDNSIFVQVAHYVVEAPRTLGNLIRVRSRVYRGNAELEDINVGFSLSARLKNYYNFVKRILARPNLWIGASVFSVVAVAAHLRNRIPKQRVVHWEQDRSTRSVFRKLRKP